jgi:hypothetical protein
MRHNLQKICSSCRLKAGVLPLPIGDNKVFDRTLTGHHGLTNMDDFCGALANSVHAEHFVRLAMEEQFEHAGISTHNDSLGDLSILGAASS